ncbi:hypothetical protein MRX96_033564 [Rhipicephalus microplus]
MRRRTSAPAAPGNRVLIARKRITGLRAGGRRNSRTQMKSKSAVYMISATSRRAHVTAITLPAEGEDGARNLICPRLRFGCPSPTPYLCAVHGSADYYRG